MQSTLISKLRVGDIVKLHGYESDPDNDLSTVIVLDTDHDGFFYGIDKYHGICTYYGNEKKEVNVIGHASIESNIKAVCEHIGK